MADDYIYERVEFEDPPETDRRARPRSASGAPSAVRTTPGPSEVSYPLVERRRRNSGPPEGFERRRDRIAELAANEVASSPSHLIEAPPLAPFRWGALVIGLVGAADDVLHDFFPTGLVLLALAAYANYTTIRPIPYRDDRPTRTLVGFDVLIHLGAVMLTGNWSSPFAITLIPSTLLAGFSAGPVYAFQLVGASAGIVTIRYLSDGISEGYTTALAWCGVLALVALTSGLARRVSQESQRQQLIALDRLGKLAEANALLFSLQRVAQTLPASLDLDDVLDSTLTRLRPLIEADAVTVLLYSDPDRSWDAVRTRGYRGPGGYSTEQLALPLRDAMLSSRSITVADLGRDGPGVADGMASGIYASLRARGTLMGLIALESREPDFFAVQHTELLNGFIEPFGIAIDNARLFRRLRSIGADEERSRIARELHDRIGNALAMIGFEVDSLTMQAQRGGDVAVPLGELRQQVSAVVGDVREALYDLRTDVSETQDLVATLTMFCERVRNRSPLDVTFTADATHRLPLLQERELWQISREAITNVERHARAGSVQVSWMCKPTAAELVIADDGQGFVKGSGRPDSYGLVGMRERAASVNAVLDITSELGVGTTIRVSMGTETGGNA
ncbi:MAG: GAF domain-containing sensor histidine kinase [Acidimicrobiia bacterium]